MAKRPVLVVHGEFMLAGERISRGAVISDPVVMGLVQAAHPEKVTRALHDCDDEPAWAPVAPHFPASGLGMALVEPAPAHDE